MYVTKANWTREVVPQTGSLHVVEPGSAWSWGPRRRVWRAYAFRLLWALTAVLVLPPTVFAENAATRWIEEALQAVRDQNVGTPNAGRL